MPAGVQVAALAERHQLLDHRAKVLGLRQGGRDLLVLDERLRHIGEHRLAVLGGAIEAPLGVSVIHWPVSLSGSHGRRATERPLFLFPLSRFRERR